MPSLHGSFCPFHDARADAAAAIGSSRAESTAALVTSAFESELRGAGLPVPTLGLMLVPLAEVDTDDTATAAAAATTATTSAAAATAASTTAAAAAIGAATSSESRLSSTRASSGRLPGRSGHGEVVSRPLAPETPEGEALIGTVVWLALLFLALRRHSGVKRTARDNHHSRYLAQRRSCR